MQQFILKVVSDVWNPAQYLSKPWKHHFLLVKTKKRP